MELTRSEREIMDVFWDEGKSLSRADLLECSKDKSWKDSSVHILLNGLLEKKVIHEAGFVKRNKTFGRVFLPTMTREEYYATASFSHKRKPEMIGLLAALMERPEMDEKALDELEKMIAQHRAELSASSKA